jgi:hypothetical protein
MKYIILVSVLILLMLAGCLSVQDIKIATEPEQPQLHSLAVEKCNETYSKNTLRYNEVSMGYWCTERITRCIPNGECRDFDGDVNFFSNRSFYTEESK